jgi:hypothetical protein
VLYFLSGSKLGNRLKLYEISIEIANQITIREIIELAKITKIIKKTKTKLLSSHQ